MMKQILKQPLVWWKTAVYSGLAGIILLGGGQAQAQIWYGNISTSWNNPTNWTPSWLIPGNIQSVPGAGTAIIVPVGCSFYPTITNNVSIGSLTLNQGSGSITVAGGTLSVTSGGISILSGSSFTINAGASVTSSAGVTAGGTWIVNGTLTAPVTMYNTVSFTINSGGTVNASSGGLNANDNGGYLYIYGTLNDGANTISDNANIIVSGGSVTAGNITLNAGGLTVTSGTLNAGGFTFFNGGNLAISGASTVTSTGTWAYDGGGYSLTGGNFTFSGANVTLPGGTFASLNLSGTGTDVLASGTTISGNFSLASGTKASLSSGLNISAGSLTLAGSGQVNGTWGSTSSTAANKNSTYFAGTGLVTVTTNVALQTTTTTLSTLAPATYGNSATLTATVAPAPGGGTVQFSTNGVAFGSPATVSGGTATLTTSALLPGSYTITAAFNGTATCSSSTSGTSTQVVNKAAVNITSGMTANNKAYDGTTTVTISSNNVVLSGVVAGDAANVALSTNSYTATFANAGAGNSVGVTVNGLTLAGSAAVYYTLTHPTGLTANISALPVTISAGLTASNKVYNGAATATINSNNVALSGVLAADAANVGLSTNGYSATFASTSTGTGVAVTVSGLTLTGSAAANYTLAQPAGLTANITSIAVTIASGISANPKTYDGTPTATINSNNVVLSGVLTADAANVKIFTNGYTATFASASAGTGVAVTAGGLILTGSAAANYTLTQPAGLTANITVLSVTISSGLTAGNKVYNGTTTATINSNSVVLGGVLAGDAAKVALSTNGYTASFAGSAAGTGLAVSVSGLTLTGSAAANYGLSRPAGLTANITAAPVSIASGITANNKAYDGTTTATISASSVVLNGVLTADAANVQLATTGYTAVFASAAAGSSLSVSVTGLTLTGSAAANYALTQPAGLTASITTVPVAIASGILANSKAYDSTTTATISSSNVLLSGVLAADAANVKLSTNGYTATFASAMVGTGLGVTVSGLTLTGSAANNYVLTQPAGLTANMTTIPVAITSGLSANSKAYDSTTAATISSNNVVLGGVLAADAANVKLSTNGYTAAFASSGTGTGVAVTVSGLTLTGSAAANYTLTQPAGLTANITSIAVTIASGISANNKPYDGTTSATISAGSVVLNGVLTADAANVKLSTNGYTATFASASAGTGVAVTVGGLTLTGSAAANYTLTQPVGLTANITVLPVAISSGLTAKNKPYDGTTTAALSVSGVVFSGILAGDTAKVALSTNDYLATFASSAVGTGVGVTVSGLTLTGTAAADYVLTQPVGLTANITSVAVTIVSGITANSKVYDGTTSATISANNVVLGGVLAADAANVKLSTNGYTATFATATAETGLGVAVSGLALSGSASANYTLAQPAGLTASITAAPVTIAAGLAINNKVYDGITTAAITVNNAALSGVLAADAANVKLSTNGYFAIFASATAGTGLGVTVSGLTLSGTAAANYTLTQPTGLTASITAAPVTITSGLSANSKAYDGTTSATINSNNVVLSGVLTADAANVKLSTNGYTATLAIAGTGTGVAVTVSGLTLAGSAAANYTLTQPAGLTANITSIPVTIASGITANNKAYDGTTTSTVSSNNVVLSGVLATDAVNVKLATNSYTATFASAGAGTGVAVTVGGLTLTGSAAANYTLTQPPGLAANITVLPVTISSGLSAKNKPYDGTTSATLSVSGVVLSGVLAGDTAKVALSTNGYLATFAGSAVGTGVGVTVSGLTLTGSAAADYVLTQPVGLIANITSVTVTIASGITANGKVYDGTTTAAISANNVVLGGLLAADAINVKLSTNGYTAAFATATAGTGLSVSVSGLSLIGAAAANYTLTPPVGLTASITTAPVTITGGLAANNKVYNGATTATISANSVVLSGVITSDTAKVSLATNGYSANFASASVGTGVAVTVSGLSLAGSAAANYSLTQPAGLTASITTAPVTISSGLAALGKVYDGTTMAAISVNKVTLGGVVTADAAKVSLSTNGYVAIFASATPAIGLAVTVSGLTLTGSAAANYTLTQPAGLTANITTAPVTIASGLTVNNKAYDGTVAATLSVNNVVLNGVVPADAANVTLATNGYTATFASAAASLGVNVTVSGLTLTGSAAANYKFTQPTGLTANITQTTLTLTSPANGQAIVGNSNSVTVAGTTTGNIPVTGVWLNLNGGNWTNATSANGWTNWSVALPAPVGADIVQAYAVDTAGNHSVTNTLTFTIIHTSVLTLTTTGSGLAGPPYNGQTLEVGQSYTVVATPQYGWMFTNWTGNLLPASTSASLNFTMASNLVLTANFVYTNYPVLAFTTPTNGEAWVTNAALVKVTGTTAGSVPLANVWLSLNGGAWTNAVTANQWRNWSSVLPVAAGSQVLSAYAVDTAGYHSLTNTVDFTLIHTSLMTVRTNGNGTVSTNYDTLHLEVGVNYTMQATGRHGWTFLSWTSNLLPSNNNVLTNNPYITFTMQSNLVLTANFVDLAPPTLTLNELAKGQTAVTNEAPLTITGTTAPAADASPVTHVWVSFNSNAWSSATSANQWTNWTAVMTPTPGLQSVRAYAVDAAGNASLTNAFTFTCRQAFPLVVRTNQTGAGLGTITPNYNGQQLIAGTTFSMKAQALPGSVFVSWTSNLLPGTNSPTFTFTMASNLVVYANFHDTTPPTLSVTSPTNGQVVTSSPLTLQGTAAGTVAVAQVWYAVNSNPWQLATGTTNWTGSVPLVPGTNVIQAYALDAANNSSHTNTVCVLYAVAGTLTLQTNGLGSIAQPATAYYIGQNYTLTAVPAKGFSFTNWTGNPVAGTNQAALKFTMVPNLSLTATFVDTQNPTVTILSPASGNVTDGSITVTGKAWDNWALGAVYCQLNGGAWTLVGASTGFTNWSLALNLTPGTNVISACSADISGQEPYGTTRYSPTNSVTVVFQTAPASLNNLRAVVTPADGSTPFEVDFGSNVFSQYAWSTNNDNDAGDYAYASPGQVTGVLQLQSSALPQNTDVQTWLLDFTNHYAAFISYTNGAGQPVTASAVFSAITNVAPATLAGQTLVSVNVLSTQTTYNFLTNGVVVAVTGTQRQTNTWTLQNFGPSGALLVLASATQTNWSLFHFETALAAEYVSENSDGTADAGLAGFVRAPSVGNAPATVAALNGGVILDNDGATLTTILLNAGAFALTTSDGSLTGAGTYGYTKLGSNEGQFILNYTGANAGTSLTSVIQFYNSNFGVVTNTAGVSGLLLH